MIILTQESHNVSASNDWNGRSSYQINSKHNETIYTGVKIYILRIVLKQLPTDRSADRSTGPISLINYLISEVINFGRM